MGDAGPVARKLKVFRTSMGFFELAIAAPSMKAAAEAWGTDPDVFRRGFAEPTEDRKIVEAAMAAPGVVLRRPVGSDGVFGEKAALPDAPADTGKQPAPRPDKVPSKSRPDPKLAEKGKREEAAAREETAAREREAAAAREKEEKRRELERRKKEAEEERSRKQREQKVARANAAFERARARHAEAVQSFTKRRKELDDDEAREDERWEREQHEHRDVLREAES
jgi:colicin import membrane protein